MEAIIEQIGSLQLLNHFWLTLFLLIPMVLIARTVVAGTRYSPILIIVIFGLAMGFILVSSGVAEPGLGEFPIVDFISRTTIIALSVTFFVGGQEIRKIFGNKNVETENLLIPSEEEFVLGTTRTQAVFILRSFFLLLGIEAVVRLLLGNDAGSLSKYYPIMAYIGIVGSVILIDNKATISNKHKYIRKGVLEIAVLIVSLVVAWHLSDLIRDLVALPQIFFAMVITTALGAIFYKYSFGPTIKALLFAGIPVVLAGNFMVGGSRIREAFAIEGLNPVIAYGFFGQVFWMFGGIVLLMYLANTAHVRNLAPGMAGALSHSGLTGACTAGDLGKQAAYRAPMMVNIPFAMHVFTFSILAISVERDGLLMVPSVIMTLIGLSLVVLGIRTIKTSNAVDRVEIKGLLQFGFGWQIIAIFGGMILLSSGGLSVEYSAMAQSSAISHFGLFAALQEGSMFGKEAAALIPFIFSMPFMVHPIVFFMFGKGMENDGQMPKLPAVIFAAIGVIGVLVALYIL